MVIKGSRTGILNPLGSFAVVREGMSRSRRGCRQQGGCRQACMDVFTASPGASGPSPRDENPKLQRYAAAALLCGLLMVVGVESAPAARPAQLDFSAFPVGNQVRFRYELRDREHDRHRIQFSVPRQAIIDAKRRFQAFSPQDLRRQAEQERRRQLERAVAGLRRAYPRAEIELKSDGSVSWRVRPPEDFRQRQEGLFERLLEKQLAAIRADFPRAEISRSSDGGYRVEAPTQAMVDAIQRRLKKAQAGANQALARYAEQEKLRMAQRSGGIGDDLREEIQGMDRRMQDFQSAYFRERLYKIQDDKYVRPDYARIARQSVSDLGPAASALAQWTRGLSQRDRLSRLLLFIQTIPYDRLENRATDAGFLVPLVMLDENRGDCDSKSVAYAVLVHLMYPDLPIELVLVPQHALLALGLPRVAGDRTLRQGGRAWVLAEPVGPGVQPVGRIGKESARGLGRIESVIPLFP